MKKVRQSSFVLLARSLVGFGLVYALIPVVFSAIKEAMYLPPSLL